MHIGLVSFWGGDLKWKFAAKRLRNQASLSNFFSVIEIYDRKSLDIFCNPSVLEFIDNNTKGYGYWIWKAPIILDFIRKNPAIDVVCYLDCGCEFNFKQPAMARWNDYLRVLENSDALFFETDCIEREWITSELSERLQVAEVELASNQIGATAFLMKREFAEQFCLNWFEIMKESNFKFLASSHDAKNQDPTFRESRWDQSIFSILGKRSRNVRILKSIDENFFPGNWSGGLGFPILITRNPSHVSIFRIGLTWDFVRLTERIISRLFSLKWRW